MIRFLLGLRLVALTFAAIAVGVLALEARKDIADGRARVAVVQVDVHDVASELKTLTRQLTVTQDQQALYFSYEQNHLRKVTIPKLDASIDSFRAAIEHTDDSLNAKGSGLLDTAGNAVALDALKLSQTTESIDQAVNIFTERSEPLLKETADAMHGFEQITNDESWKRTAENLAASSEATSETMGNVNAASKDIRDAVHDYVHPHWASKVLGLVKSVGDNAITLARWVF